jgi:hypothetical protein
LKTEITSALQSITKNIPAQVLENWIPFLQIVRHRGVLMRTF